MKSRIRVVASVVASLFNCVLTNAYLVTQTETNVDRPNVQGTLGDKLSDFQLDREKVQLTHRAFSLWVRCWPIEHFFGER